MKSARLLNQTLTSYPHKQVHESSPGLTPAPWSSLSPSAWTPRETWKLTNYFRPSSYIPCTSLKKLWNISTEQEKKQVQSEISWLWSVVRQHATAQEPVQATLWQKLKTQLTSRQLGPWSQDRGGIYFLQTGQLYRRKERVRVRRRRGVCAALQGREEGQEVRGLSSPLKSLCVSNFDVPAEDHGQSASISISDNCHQYLTPGSVWVSLKKTELVRISLTHSESVLIYRKHRIADCSYVRLRHCELNMKHQ